MAQSERYLGFTVEEWAAKYQAERMARYHLAEELGKRGLYESVPVVPCDDAAIGRAAGWLGGDLQWAANVLRAAGETP